MKKEIRINSFKAWVLASRPKTLTGAAVPVMVGTALALRNSAWHIGWWQTALCFLFAFLMQIDANYVNDYFDFVRGNDDETRLGPRRACAQGWVTTAAMRRAIWVTTVLACAVGLPLAVVAGWKLIAVGALCVLFCFLYTTHLSYKGVGDLLVLLFFGVIPVVFTYYVVMPSGQRSITPAVVVAGLCCGLVIDTLLIVNNYRDIDNDKRAGKKTLVVALGLRKSGLLYLLVGYAACALGVVFALEGAVWTFVLPCLYLVFHTRTHLLMMQIGKGKALNMVLGKTARNIFLYGMLLTLGIFL